jgi:hypothetical protein
MPARAMFVVYPAMGLVIQGLLGNISNNNIERQAAPFIALCIYRCEKLKRKTGRNKKK